MSIELEHRNTIVKMNQSLILNYLHENYNIIPDPLALY